MKKITYFKQALIQVTFVTSILLIASCSTHQKSRNTTAASREQSDAKYQTDRNNQTNQTDRDNQTNQTDRNNQTQTDRNNQTYQTDRNNQTDKNNYADKNNQTDSIKADKNKHTDHSYHTDKTNHADKDNQADNNNRTDDNNQIGQNNQKDAQFLVSAAETNLEEIQLGQLAQQNGGTPHVRELGKMMEDAHTKALDDLTALARRKSITIPTSPTDNAQDAYKTLNEKSGKDFDKAYTDMMVSGHKDAIAAFEKASTDFNDTDIKNWATASLTDLRKHLDHSIDSQKKCDNMMYLEKKN